jgi:hypothetical protein
VSIFLVVIVEKMDDIVEVELNSKVVVGLEV